MRRLIGMTRPGGVLCLGEAEWPLPELACRLVPLSGKTRLFRVRPEMPSDEHNLSISPQPQRVATSGVGRQCFVRSSSFLTWIWALREE